MKEERKIERQAEEILCSFGENVGRQDVALFDEILAGDENYQKYAKIYGNRRYRDPKKQVLRSVAVLLIALLAASFVVPVPQASAWRIWWLDLFTGEGKADVQVDAENAYDFVEYYPGELPDGFELVSDEVVNRTKHETKYEDANGKYIFFSQKEIEKASDYVDKEKAETTTRLIGNFEVVVTYSQDDVIFEFTAEQSVGRIHTNAGYAIGKEFIENLIKK